MRERGMSTIGGVLLAGLAGLFTATLLVDWVVVDVHVVDVANSDALEVNTPVHVKVPFPLLIADVATSFIPERLFDETEVPEEAKQHRELVLATVKALLDSPDSTLVKVQCDDANVDITKTGDNLLIAVDADDAVVRCKIPIDGVYKALEDWDWERFDPNLILDVLHAADNGNMVSVATDDGVRVAIKMW